MIASIDPGKRLTKEDLQHLKSLVNGEENPVVYLSCDPGKASGICGYDKDYTIMFMLTIHADDVLMFINQFEKLKKFIVEGYRIFPNKAKEHIYSDLLTPRVIGRIESWCELNIIDLIRQPPNFKATGYKWIGQKPLPKSNPRNHSMDAHVHFIYWAVCTGRIKLEDLLK